MKKIKMRNEEVTQLLDADVVLFPKYATQLINLANQNAQGTRPEQEAILKRVAAHTGKSYRIRRMATSHYSRTSPASPK